MKTAGSIRVLFLVFALAGLLAGCGKNSSSGPTSLASGKSLAAIACAQCHTVPSPAQLPPEEWPYLLAWMGTYLGHAAEIEIDPNLIVKNFVPPQRVVTREQFDAIRNYFIEQSAIQYQRRPPMPEPPASRLFEPIPVAIPAAAISMVAVDPADRSLIVGASQPARLFVVRDESITSMDVPSEPVTVERVGGMLRIALIGTLARDLRQGQIVDINVNDGTHQVRVDGHARIAAHRTADLDTDGKDDLVVCGFGDYPFGRVGVFWGGEEKSEEDLLLEEAGATWCDVADLDGDGKRDIVIAIGSNRARLVAFVNEGGRRFTPRTIVDRPVGWGYNRCLLVDWDGDGKVDIVECAGNNIELRGRPLKPSHGVRVLHNDGGFKFHEILFEQLYGAMDVAAGDFDHNGRVDLAVTAFCPDWRLAFPTTLVFLMQRPDGTVERAGIDNRYWNRWFRVGAGDVDGDGWTDLIVGAADVWAGIPAEEVSRFAQLFQDKPTVLVLRNRGTRNAEPH